ncbi:ATP-grasp fold amidoligase family protein [Alkalibacterium sp. m-11]
MKSLKVNKLKLFNATKYGNFKWMPDEQFIRLQYALKMRKDLNLENPKTFNEKIQWLKLNDRNPKYTQLVDKYAVRKFVKERIGGEYLVPIYGVYENDEAIDFDALPDKFVLKMTHTSGGVFIIEDKARINHDKLKAEIDKWFDRNYYWVHREWPYKNVQPKIMAEKFMVDESEKDLKDYKFFCFEGEPKFMFVASERGKEAKFDFFDLDFNQLPVMQQGENSDQQIKKPNKFDEMIELARTLSEGIPHVRVDLYNINSEIYFGELTFYHNGGYGPFIPEAFDYKFGEYLQLPGN